jgi:acetyl esterase/lipase
MKIACAFLLLFCCINISAQQKVIQLYTNAAPGSEQWNWGEGETDNNMFNTKLVYNVVHPTLTVLLPDASAAPTGTAIIVCPGGGFRVLSINSEGFDVARALAKKGVTVFVLKYRVGRSLTDDPAKELMAKMGKKDFDEENAVLVPMAIADGRAALSYVRKHAGEYNINTDRIGIIGFSAGGTVAASSAYDYTPENRPDFVAPIYPYMPPALQKNIPANAPPMFLAAASDDNLGLAPHSVDLYNKWIASKHPAELHLYQKGGHGFGMRKQNLPTDSWIDRYIDWLGLLGYLKPIISKQ